MFVNNPPHGQQQPQYVGVEMATELDMSDQLDPEQESISEGVFEEDHSATENEDDLTPHKPTTAKSRKEEESELVSVKSETHAVWGVRVVVAMVLVGVALAVCLVVAAGERDNEQDNFETAYLDMANQFVTAFENRIQQRSGTVQSFSMELTSQFAIQKAQNENLTWPFFSPQHYYQRAEEVAKLAFLSTCHLTPRVESAQRSDWIKYSNKNSHWIEEALQHQGLEGEDAKPGPIAPFLFTTEGGSVNPLGSNVDGPYFPIWMQWPVAQQTLTNLDMYHDGTEAAWSQFESVYQTNKPSWPRAFDFSDEGDTEEFVYQQIKSVYPWYVGDAVNTVLYPVYEEFGNRSSKIVAFLIAGISWNSYFASILPPGSPTIMVILQNFCGQTYSWTVSGDVATQVGKKSDLHDAKYDYLELFSDVNSLIGVDEASFNVTKGNCGFSIRVYPTSSFEEGYKTNGPKTYALSLAAVFVFTCATFLLYDWLVERRQKAVMKSALQSGKLVSSLFPKDIRDRLYEEQDAQMRKEQRNAEWKSSQHKTAAPMVDQSSIARLYTQTTVLFSDLAGFTKWSSTRSPEQVFFFLETLYGSYDLIARRYGVFKVETIGDCYVAVSGLPQPQTDHAVIMCRFAKACMSKFRLTVAELAEKLGEDTMSLDMRVGLNSGPVTAGVLRGEKQRFQLFGDTVNVASRMESTGTKGRIQCSEETAKNLRERKKDHWLRQREDVVVAKGKGEMVTYWVEVGGKNNTNNSATSRMSHTNDDLLSNEVDGPLSNKTGIAGQLQTAEEIGRVDEELKVSSLPEQTNAPEQENPSILERAATEAESRK